MAVALVAAVQVADQEAVQEDQEVAQVDQADQEAQVDQVDKTSASKLRGQSEVS